MIHGGIDGYSRLITYLQCSNNNRSDTVLAAFVGACEVFGVPSRVRSDKGGENIDIWRYMTATRGEYRKLYIAGPSVHNTRIERLWRDVYMAVTTVYVKIFLELEESGALDPNNDADSFCLHYVFLPRINSCLKAFSTAWNNHGLSTADGASPLQLFTAGLMTTDDETFLDDIEVYGVDTDESITGTDEEEDTSVVEVPATNFPLSETSLDILSTTIDPEAHSANQGKDTYTQTVSLLHSLMQNDGLI